jgi:diguanylate cyclase (GGDEF)-like protein/hemerythrin-like metal-binding protein
MTQRKQTILIVDDQSVNLHILAEALQPNYEIIAATSGTTALELAQQTDQPDLILLDIMMPGIDGYEVCRRLKASEKTKNIPVIFVTAHTELSEEEIGLNLGAVDYISKPYRIPILLARVRNHLNTKRKTDLLEALVSLDGLTGIPNRRKFNEILDFEWRRAVRSGKHISIVMLDIDHFKQYNDLYGHAAGDDCLIKVANFLLSCVSRPGDLVARYGGEEFVALLPLTTAEGAIAVSERFVRGVSALLLPHKHSGVADHVTISAGSATVIPTKNISMAAMLHKADEMLYQAKREGRNRVIACSSKEGLTCESESVSRSSTEENELLPEAEQSTANLVKLIWQSSYDSGSELIDTQHKSLFQLSNTLLEAILESQPKETVSAIVTRLLDDIKQHFRDEEHLLGSIGFPGLTQHALEHKILYRKGLEMAQEFVTDTLHLGVAVEFLVYEVVQQHMLVADREFFSYLHDTAG